MYKAQQAGAAAGADGGPSSGGPSGSSDHGSPNQTPPQGGDVVDAEFVDVDNSKQPN
jgi:hypothetical protein